MIESLINFEISFDFENPNIENDIQRGGWRILST